MIDLWPIMANNIVVGGGWLMVGELMVCKCEKVNGFMIHGGATVDHLSICGGWLII